MHWGALYVDDCPRAALGRMAALVKEAEEGGAGYMVSLYELRTITCPKSSGRATSQESRRAAIR